MRIADTEMFLYLGGIHGQWFLASGWPLEQNSLQAKFDGGVREIQL